MSKLYGSNDPVVSEIGVITQQVGAPLLPIDLASPSVAFQVRDYFGWDFHQDGEFILTNKRSLGVGTHQLTNDGTALTVETDLPNGATPFWNVTTNLIEPQVDGAFNTARFSFLTSLQASTAKIRLLLRSATTNQIFASHNENLNSAFGDTSVTFVAPFYTDALAISEGLELAIDVQEIQGGPFVDIWNLQCLIGRTA